MRRAVLVLVIGLLAISAFLSIREGTERQTLVAGATLVAVGLPLLILSRLQLGHAFSVAPKATTLVTNGVYARIPHPMYAFLDVALLGVVIVLRQQWLIAVWLGLVLVHAWAARREAAVLERAFGEAYRTYRAHAWW